MNRTKSENKPLSHKRHFQPEQVLALGFLIAIMVGTLMLTLPFSSSTGKSVGLLGAAFTATSAVCVTGLNIVDIGLGYSNFGHGVIIALIQMGGLGFIAFQFMLKNITIRVDENTVKAGEEAPKFNVFAAFGNFMRNRPAVGATLAAMGMFLGMNAASTANTIMFATYFNMASMSGLVQLIGFLPMFLFMPFITKIVEKSSGAAFGSLSA